MTERAPDAVEASGAPRECVECRRPLPDYIRPTWTRQRGALLLCHDCQKGY